MDSMTFPATKGVTGETKMVVGSKEKVNVTKLAKPRLTYFGINECKRLILLPLLQ
jgi:hypothetical protein